MLESARDPVRRLTSDEVDACQRDGWVKADSLIPADLAAHLHDIATGLYASNHADVTSDQASKDNSYSRPQWSELRYPSRVNPMFHAVSHSETLGRNISLLSGRDVPVRYWSDILACKAPATSEDGAGPTTWHQDFPSLPIDRTGSTAVWIALADVTPDHGSMRFMSGSHHAGVLGTILDWDTSDRIMDRYPYLRDRYRMCEPLHYRPGDATFHHSLTVHGAPENSSTSNRWGYICTGITADCLFTAAPTERDPRPTTVANRLDLPPFSALDHPNFPVIYAASNGG